MPVASLSIIQTLWKIAVAVQVSLSDTLFFLPLLKLTSIFFVRNRGSDGLTICEKEIHI